MVDSTTPLDNKDGIAYLVKWAKIHGFVLDMWHEEIARKHGVSVDGVAVAHPIPIHTPTTSMRRTRVAKRVKRT